MSNSKSMLLPNLAVDDRNLICVSHTHPNGYKFRSLMKDLLEKKLWKYIRNHDKCNDIDELITRCEIALTVKCPSDDISDDDLRIFGESFIHERGLEFRRIMQKTLNDDLWKYVRGDKCDDIETLIGRCESLLAGKFSFPS